MVSASALQHSFLTATAATATAASTATATTAAQAKTNTADSTALSQTVLDGYFNKKEGLQRTFQLLQVIREQGLECVLHQGINGIVYLKVDMAVYEAFNLRVQILGFQNSYANYKEGGWNIGPHISVMTSFEGKKLNRKVAEIGKIFKVRFSFDTDQHRTFNMPNATDVAVVKVFSEELIKLRGFYHLDYETPNNHGFHFTIGIKNERTKEYLAAQREHYAQIPRPKPPASARKSSDFRDKLPVSRYHSSGDWVADFRALKYLFALNMTEGEKLACYFRSLDVVPIESAHLSLPFKPCEVKPFCLVQDRMDGSIYFKVDRETFDSYFAEATKAGFKSYSEQLIKKDTKGYIKQLEQDRKNKVYAKIIVFTAKEVSDLDIRISSQDKTLITFEVGTKEPVKVIVEHNIIVSGFFHLLVPKESQTTQVLTVGVYSLEFERFRKNHNLPACPIGDGFHFIVGYKDGIKEEDLVVIDNPKVQAKDLADTHHSRNRFRDDPEELARIEAIRRELGIDDEDD